MASSQDSTSPAFPKSRPPAPQLDTADDRQDLKKTTRGREVNHVTYSVAGKVNYEATEKSTPPTRRSDKVELVTFLFPRVADVWSTHAPRVGASRARRELLICAPERFPVYFRLSVSADEFKAAEVAHFLEIARNPEEFSAKLLALTGEMNPDGTSRARSALERLEDVFEESLPEESACGAVRGLIEAGDRLLIRDDSRPEMFDMANEFRVSRCLYLLTRQLGQEKLGALLEEAIQQASSLTVLVQEIASLAHEHGQIGTGAAPSGEQRVTLGQLENLKIKIVERIRSEAENGTLGLVTKQPIHARISKAALLRA